MNIKLVHQLLADKNIKTTVTDTSIEESLEPWENRYKLQLKEEKWIFMFVKWEKSDGKEEILKVFNDEETASKFYYFHRLHSYCFWKYVLPFEENNADINIGEPQFNLVNLKEAFQILGISEDYYSLEGKLKEHSIVLERVNEHKSKVKFIGENCKVISESLDVENWNANTVVYQRVYYLFLLDQECNRLIEAGIIDKRFTDEEYYTFLSPGV